MIEEVRKRLFALQDVGYKAFHCKLVPGVDPDRIIGIRTPALRALTKELARDERIGIFLNTLPHTYYEEYSLHGAIVCEMKDYDACVREIDRLLPLVDNWGTCDSLSPKVFKPAKNHARLIVDIRRWMDSAEPYTIRFGIGRLMCHFLDEDFRPEYLAWVANERSEHYYVRMMVAWFFATALAKQWEATIPFIEQQRLAPWTHNKAIQKAIESYRISDERKEYLKTLRVRSQHSMK